MTSIDQHIGTLFAFMGLSLTLIALLSAVIIFYQGYKHSKILDEISSKKEEIAAMAEGVLSAIKRNEVAIREISLGMSRVSMQLELEDQRVAVDSIQVSDGPQSARKLVEISKIEEQIHARRLETFLVLNGVNQGVTRLQHLVREVGDESTLVFLEEVVKIYRAKSVDPEKIIEAKGALRSRIRRAPAPLVGH